MQMLFLPKPFRQCVRVDESRLSERARARLAHLKAVWGMVEGGCPVDVAIAGRGVSRRTFFRWQAAFRRRGPRGLEPRSTRPAGRRGPQWGTREVKAVIAMRERFPFMGARALRVMLRREGAALSLAAVQRIVRLCLKRKWIKPVAWLRGRAKPKRRRDFGNSHAKRWRHGMKARAPGELVQIDHMTVSRDGQVLKEFRAVDPVTRIMVCRVFSRATARNARRFLDAVLAEMPFKVSSLQADGGSEFMADFEQACAERSLPLFILPPRSPKWNGRVERCNDTVRLEFWSLWDGDLTVSAVSEALARHQRWHNRERPHSALDFATPLEQLAKLQNKQLAA